MLRRIVSLYTVFAKGVVLDFFSTDYAAARRRFIEFAQAAGAHLDSLPLDAKGPGNEDLTIDIAWLGPTTPKRILLHSSGLHGVEGFAGSAIQLSMLREPPKLPADTTLVLTHILNPYGMAWLRRVNENNVDLNRNCRLDGNYSGAPEGYAKLNALLNPASPPSPDLYLAHAASLILRHGLNAMKQSIAGGQYEFPKGLFFGGHEKQQGIAIYEAFLRRRLVSIDHAIAIDVHSGLGSYAKDTLLVVPEDFESMRRIFGDRVSALATESGPAYRVSGGLESLIFDIVPPPKGRFIGQEFGTFGPVKVLGALRQENRWHQYGSGSLIHPAKQRLKEVFFPSDESWQRAVIGRGRELVIEALKELRA